MALDFNSIEKQYITGKYKELLQFLLKKDSINLKVYDNDVTNAIRNSYISRALIRLGRINEAEKILNQIHKVHFSEFLTIQDFINETSLINLLITQGKSNYVISTYKDTDHIIDNFRKQNPQLTEFWGSYFYFLIGMANYYELQYSESMKYFFKSLEVNKSNKLIEGKSYYYLAFNSLEQNILSDYEYYLNKSTNIYKEIDAKQGLGWNLLWKGNYLLQKGIYEQAIELLAQSSQLFTEIGAAQEQKVIQSVYGLMYFNQGNLEKARKLLNDSFITSIKFGNPMLSSYILLPFILVNIEGGHREIIKEYLPVFEKFNQDSRVSFHLKLAKAIFLKASSRFTDKALAEQLLTELLEISTIESNHMFTTLDKSIKFYLTINIAEIYYMEFILSNDLKILHQIQVLLDNFRKITELKISNELIETSILKSKVLVVEGKINEALDELSLSRELAVQHNYVKQIDNIDKEMKIISDEIEKWGLNDNILERIKIADMELYIKEAQNLTRA